MLRLPAVINPETTNMLALTGLAARLNPGAVDDIVARLPRNPNVDLTLRTLLSADYAAFVTGVPDVRALHATNEAVLGLIMDDNSMPFGFIQASVGFPRGPVRPKTFPQPSPALVAADDPTVVYGWDDYDAVVPNAFTDRPARSPPSRSSPAACVSNHSTSPSGISRAGCPPTCPPPTIRGSPRICCTPTAPSATPASPPAPPKDSARSPTCDPVTCT